MKTYYFNTGVKIGWGIPPVVLHDGEILSSNGVKLIPLNCEGVPDNAIFKFAADGNPSFSKDLHKAKIHNSKLISEYAYFLIPTKHDPSLPIQPKSNLP